MCKSNGTELGAHGEEECDEMESFFARKADKDRKQPARMRWVTFAMIVGAIFFICQSGIHRQLKQVRSEVEQLNESTYDVKEDSDFSSGTTAKRTFLPEILYEEWKTKHSKETLQAEILHNGVVDPNRKYVLARYSCPHRAGNFLNYLTWHVLMGILLDRTVVWEYFGSYENTTSSRAECDQVLELASWLPEYMPDYFSREELQGGDTFVAPSTKAIQKQRLFASTQYDLVGAKAVFFGEEPFQNTQIGEIWYHDMLLNEKNTHDWWLAWLGIQDVAEFDRKIYYLYDQGHAYLRVSAK